MNSIDYLNLMDQEYFDICNGKSVLEIGPGNSGFHTELIAKKNTKSIDLIEPGYEIHTFKLNLDLDLITIIHDDAMVVLSKPYPKDVVVCCGVLYHLHSPLHLLELIVNNCDPEYIILDCVNSPQKISFIEEIDNLPGHRQTINEWKSCKFNLVAPFEIINMSMYNLGYSLTKTHELKVTDNLSKSNSWVGLWSKKI
jgi:hypothetical protein